LENTERERLGKSIFGGAKFLGGKLIKEIL